MKLIWSPETASKAYIDTVKSCTSEEVKESGVAELLSAMAGGWDAKLIVETWNHGGQIATSVGLRIAARHSCGRHVCLVPDEKTRIEYERAMRNSGAVAGDSESLETETEVVVGDPAKAMAALGGVDFLVVDCRRRDFSRVLRSAKVSSRGAVFACKNAWQQNASGFRWQCALERGTRVVRAVFLPVGTGLDVAHIGSASGGAAPRAGPSRWIRHVDQRSGEEHMFRE